MKRLIVVFAGLAFFAVIYPKESVAPETHKDYNFQEAIIWPITYQYNTTYKDKDFLKGLGDDEGLLIILQKAVKYINDNSKNVFDVKDADLTNNALILVRISSVLGGIIEEVRKNTKNQEALIGLLGYASKIKEDSLNIENKVKRLNFVLNNKRNAHKVLSAIALNLTESVDALLEYIHKLISAAK